MAVAWTDFDVWTGVTEIQVRASTDGGATFNLSSIPQPSYPPRMVTDESGRLYVLGEEGDYLVDMKLFLAVSTDDGSRFGTPLLLAGPTADVRGDLAVLSDGALLVASLERADGGS